MTKTLSRKAAPSSDTICISTLSKAHKTTGQLILLKPCGWKKENKRSKQKCLRACGEGNDE
nr:MAG TPA: hypothetical protein [Caudoviricetes sp.]